MSNKIILDTDIKCLADKDILVYDSKKQCFINVKKAVFLGELQNEINSTKKENISLKTQINALQEKFNSLLNVLIKEKL